MINTRYARFAWGFLAYNLLVILWGAFVRATGSGAGCGDHWPLCNGEVIPRPKQIETMIEFAHRVSSGVALIGVIILFVWARRAYQPDHAVRMGARLSLILMIVESLLGAGLVLFKLVTTNDTIYRVVAMSLHQINTLLLIGAIALTAWWASGGTPVQLRGRGTVSGLLGVAVIGMLLIGATGAITALGDTLFPIKPGTNGLERAMDDTAHFIEQLRVIHPGVAVALSIYVTALSWYLVKQFPNSRTETFAWVFTGLFLTQLVVGAFNVALFAPVWMQLFHLLMADLTWLSLVLLGAVVLARPSTESVHVSTSQPIPAS